MEVLIGILLIAGVIWLATRRGAEPKSSQSRTSDRARSTSSRPVDRGVQNSARAGQQAWVPPGEAVTVRGRVLPRGMLYVGSGVQGVSSYGPTEAALIDPELRTDDRSPDVHGSEMGYWPSYAEISPRSRAAYLDWLEAGRPGGAYIGYVFLFFYGIERRVLLDAPRSEEARAELPALISEIERLLELHGDNHSFRGYASSFLSFARLGSGPVDTDTLTAPMSHEGWDFPISLRLALGMIVDAGEPLPARWALSWFRTHPEINLRTPATRCADEFNELFKIRYDAKFGDGLKIPRNKTPLKLSYQPASGTLGDSAEIDIGSLPDVARLKGPIRRIHELANEVSDELDAYSRWVGKRDDRDSIGAVALLPRELADTRQPDELRSLIGRVRSALGDAESATISVQELITDYPSRTSGRLTPTEAKAFAELLEKHGFGVVPDMRYSQVNLSKHDLAAVFRVSNGPSEPSIEYLRATVLMNLGAAVSAADGTVTEDEERHLEAYLEQTLGLPPSDSTRLRAHLQWLLAEPPKLTGMKSRLRALAPENRELVGHFVMSVAAADGHISPEEVKTLRKIYGLIGLEPERVHRDLHTLASGPASRPVTVMPSEEPTGHPIPPPPGPASQESDHVLVLDRERVVAVMAATEQVAGLLTEIFEGPTEEDDEPFDDASEEDDVEDSSIGGLGAAHESLVRHLAQQPTWPRAEFEAMANELDLMPSGAIETINDIAFEACDEPLIEGDDPLEVNEFALKELLHDR